jgi:hypothetical protein
MGGEREKREREKKKRLDSGSKDKHGREDYILESCSRAFVILF